MLTGFMRHPRAAWRCLLAPDDTGGGDDNKGGDAGTPPGGGDPAGGGEDVTALRNAYERTKAERNELKKRLADLERAQADSAAAAKAAEDKRLAEQGEFKTLAEKAQAEAAELRAKVEAAATLEAELAETREAVKAQVAARVKALKVDAATLELLEGKTPTQQLAWLAKHEDELAKRTGVAIPGTPAETSTPGKLSEEERARHNAAVRARTLG